VRVVAEPLGAVPHPSLAQTSKRARRPRRPPTQVDPHASVRRWLAEFCGAAAAARPSCAVLKAAAQALGALVADDAPQVSQQAALAAHGVLRTALALHAAHAHAHAVRGFGAWESGAAGGGLKQQSGLTARV
jgi:hypothetical protein